MRQLVPSPVRQLASEGTLEHSTVGAALIIDAEGSTALSARLAPFGTEGAESLAEILTAIFKPMVDNVVSESGAVVEMAGDGILAVFAGEPGKAVARATRAAARVMDDLASLSSFETPAGSASLTVRATIGAGSINWIIWSDEADSDQNAAYAASGSAIDEARAGELLTPGGLISAGPAARTHLGGQLADDLAEGFACVRPPDTQDVVPSSPRSESTESSLRFVPDYLESEDLRSEFRDVVSVFVEIESDRATAILAVLDRLSFRQGYLNHVTLPAIGSGTTLALVLWGAPVGREHDVGHALRFVDDLKAQFGQALRAGVTRSVSFTGFIGDSNREVYTAIGPSVNLASRMCGAAEWGEVRADPDVVERLAEPWGFDRIGDLEYRGFTDPVETWEITNVPPVRVADALDGSLVGRQHELDSLEDALAPLWSGENAGVVIVAGEPGIGKSKLVNVLEEHLSRREPAPVWVRAQADEISTQPLATIRDAMAGYFGRPGRAETGGRLDEYLAALSGTGASSTELARTRATLGDLLELEDDVLRAAMLDPKTRFENVVIAVQNLVEAVDRSSPVVIAIADGQWMDSGTAEILHRVSEELDEARLAIIIETRDSESEQLGRSRTIQLEPLSSDEMTQLSVLSINRPMSDEAIATLVDRADGNPFFALQLAHYLNQSDSIVGVEAALAALESDVPLDMRRLLVARLDGLAPQVRSTVQTAAVLGRDVDIRVLERISSEPSAVKDRVAAAVNAGIWNPIDDNTVRFTNLLIRDAGYGMLLHADARSIHSQAATAIGDLFPDIEGTAAQRAYHLDRAGDTEKAVELYSAAGAESASRYDNEEALSHFQRSLDLMPRDAVKSRFELLRRQHDVHQIRGDREAQQEILSAMKQLPDGPIDLASDLALLEAGLLISLGEYVEAEKALNAVEPSTATHGAVLMTRVQLARYQGRNSEALEMAEEARSYAAANEDWQRVAALDDLAGGIAWESGDFEKAAALHTTAAEAFASGGHVMQVIGALNNLGTAIFALGDYSRARQIHQEGAATSRDIGYRMGEGDHLDNMGGTAWAVGDFAKSLEYYGESLSIREGMEDAWGVAISKGNLGSTHRAMGNPGQALALYREALEIDKRIGRRRGEAYDHHGIGLCHLDMGRLNLAVESLKTSAGIRSELGEVHLANESKIAAAVALLRRGDLDAAQAMAQEALEQEGEAFFEGAVETTAARLRAVEVMEAVDPQQGKELREETKAGVLARAQRISDPDQRRSYLEDVVSHSSATESRPT